MTREETLRNMVGPELIKEADKLGVKVSTNKERTKLAESKAKVVDRILVFEAEQAAKQPEVNAAEIMPPTPKRGALIEWDGRSQNICAWANELGISANTLYGRLYKLGWTIDKAFTTKGRA